MHRVLGSGFFMVFAGLWVIVQNVLCFASNVVLCCVHWLCLICLISGAQWAILMVLWPIYAVYKLRDSCHWNSYHWGRSVLNDLFSHLCCRYLLWKLIKNRLEDISELTGFPCMHWNKIYEYINKIHTFTHTLFLSNTLSNLFLKPFGLVYSDYFILVFIIISHWKISWCVTLLLITAIQKHYCYFFFLLWI